MPYQIKWNKNAVKQFSSAINYIEKDSILNAEKFKIEILGKIDSLINIPTKYLLDKYKRNNDGSFRAFELNSYRVSYRIKENEIRIIRIRHTSMNPAQY
jgi:plasmid stabilization system protein ParE